MRIVFMGTPEFAVPSLDMLVKEGYSVVAVVTQPDKPKGRGKKMSFPPVKEYALNAGIPVLQPSSVKTPDFADELKGLEPDLLITVAYGKILPQAVLDIPPLGCINVHGSLLPKYRGAAPINCCIIQGEKTTGITTMYTDIGMDTGDMLLKSEMEITEDMTAGELHDQLSSLGATVLKDTLEELEKGTLKRIPQPKDEATYASMLCKDLGSIDWTKPSDQVHDLVRGTNPWPGAFTYYQGEKMKVWKTEVLESTNVNGNPGVIKEVSKEGITVACGKGALRIIEVQFESCRRMCISEYICGHKIDEGETLG